MFSLNRVYGKMSSCNSMFALSAKDVMIIIAMGSCLVIYLLVYSIKSPSIQASLSTTGDVPIAVETISRMKYILKARKVKDVDCSALFTGDSKEVERARSLWRQNPQ